jgi:hypothetical protein
MDNPFDCEDLTVLQAMSPDQQAAKLAVAGELDFAAQPTQESGRGSRHSFLSLLDKFKGDSRRRLFLNTTHLFGFVSALEGNRSVPIRDVGDIDRSEVLDSDRIDIAVNRLRVAAYPGSGIHRILFDFYAQNTLGDQVEDLHFNATYRVKEGDHAGVRGYPIFLGLKVGKRGAAFRGFTVNVKNDNDQKFLDLMDSSVFQAGLKLATSVQPAIKPLSELAFGLTRAFAKRNENIAVQDFFLGLDREPTAMGARLAAGDYVIVQVPQDEADQWNWDGWQYFRSAGRIAKTTDQNTGLPFNHIVISVSPSKF